MLSAITLVGGRTGEGESRAEGRYSLMLRGCHDPVGGWGWTPSCWGRHPEDLFWAGSLPFKCVFSSFLALGPFPQRGAMLKQVGPIQALSSWLGMSCTWSASKRSLSYLQCTACAGASDCCPLAAQTKPQVQVFFVPHSWSLPPASATPCPVVEPHPRAGGIHVGFWCVSGIGAKAVVDQLPWEFQGASYALPE